MRRWWGIGILAVLLCLGTFHAAGAHATLARSDPPANSELASSPAAIRLWFSEGVEPKFSAFTLLDARGQTVSTPASQVDPTDSTQLFMQPPALPNGLYTLVGGITESCNPLGRYPALSRRVNRRVRQ